MGLNMVKFCSLSFYFMMIIFSVCSENLVYTWIFLEISGIVFIFIMLIMNEKFKFTVDSMINYFFIQAMSSMLLMYSIILLMIYDTQYILSFCLKFLLLISLMMKMGIFPFHTWMVYIISNSSWYTNYLLMTFQKIIPLVFMSLIKFNNFIMFILLLSSIMSTLLMMNKSSVKKIFSYSSSSHSAWILLISLVSMKFLLLYLLIYFIILLILCLMNKKFLINSVDSFYMLNIFYKYMYFMMFMSLSGLPPMLGFGLKLILFNLMLDLSFFNIYLLIIATIISFYMYFSCISPILYISMFSQKMYKMKTINVNYIFVVYLVLILMWPMLFMI